MNTEKQNWEISVRGEYPEYIPKVLHRMGCVDYKVTYGLITVTCTEEELNSVLKELSHNYVKVIGVENTAETLIEVKFGNIDNKYKVIDIYNKQKDYMLSKTDIESILESDRDRNRLNSYIESYNSRFYVKKSMLQHLISK